MRVIVQNKVTRFLAHGVYVYM